MRLNRKKLLQLLLAAFLLCFIYLNIADIGTDTDTRQVNGAFPWGDKLKNKPHPLIFENKKIHDHFASAASAATKGKGGGAAHVTKAGGKLVQKQEDAAELLSKIATPEVITSEMVYPSAERYDDDRIQYQLKYVPESLRLARKKGEVKPKKILVYSGTGSWRIPRGDQLFKEQQCAVQECELVDDRSKMSEADVVLFQSSPPGGQDKRPPEQVWVINLLESPYHSTSLGNSRGLFNWTATYRHDSTIVAPYEKYIPLNNSLLTRKPTKNYAEGKSKKVAWFVSNCGARNKRRQYAEELSKHIQVDIYGACGTLRCPRFQSDKCFGMLNTHYKFYLAFENSNCRDYISEKFFINGLKHDVIPIAMGAAPEDYRRVAPPNSFIHVDDFESPKELAHYLLKLDADDDLYNQYFGWKGLWDNINTFFWCRMCAMAHDTGSSLHYEDVEKWWRGPEVCIDQDNWRQRPRHSKLIGDLPVV